MTKELEYIRDINYLISENYSDKEPLTENQKESKECFLRYCDEINQSLIKAQEQEKVLEIIKEKPNIVIAVKRYSTYDNFKANNMNSNIIEEEFDLLKRYFKC